MVQKLEAIKGGGGSVKVGAVGTISSLMSRELEPTTSSNASSVSHHMQSSPTKPRKSDDEASSSIMSACTEHRGPDSMRKTKGQDQRQIIGSSTPKQQMDKSPIKNKDISITSSRLHRNGLDFSGKTRSHKHSPPCHSHKFSSEYTHLEKTPLREKPIKKGSNIVDVVDVNCGNSAGSISNRLKKLGLSRMSQSFM